MTNFPKNYTVCCRLAGKNFSAVEGLKCKIYKDLDDWLQILHCSSGLLFIYRARS